MNTYIILGSLGLVWLIGAALTYSRAENDGRNGSLWGAFALFAGPLAWIAYKVTSDREPLGEHTPINTPEIAAATALHTGYSKGVTRLDPHIASHADEDFRDPYVERLIKKGDMRAAKEAVRSLIETAKESSDLKMLASYEMYAQRIRHIELDKVRREAPNPIAGPPSDFVDNTDMLHAAKADEGPGLHRTLI